MLSGHYPIISGFFAQKNSVAIAFNVLKLNSPQRGVQERGQPVAEVLWAVSFFHPSVLKLFAILLLFCHLQYRFVISEVTRAQRGPCFPLLPRPADRYQPGVGRPVYVPEQDWECWPVPPSPSPKCCCGASGSWGAGKESRGRAVCPCCIVFSAPFGVSVGHPLRPGKYSTPPAPRCITWLLVFCCCFFPPAFVAVGCDWGQVTGQDVLLLWRHGHANKLHSFQELFRLLEGDHLCRQVVSTAAGTAVACATASPPDPLAWGLPGARVPPKMSGLEVFGGTEEC